MTDIKKGLMMRHIMAPAILALAFSTPAMAEISDPGFGVNVGASTLGLTVEPNWRINDRFGVRAPVGSGSFSFSREVDGMEHDGEADSFGVGLLGDYYPFGGGFRISAGAFVTDYSADMTTGDVSSGVVTARIDSVATQRDKVMPAIAAGYDLQVGERGVISLTGGTMFGSGFDVESLQTVTLFGEDVSDRAPRAEDQISSLEEDFDSLKVLPYAQVSFGIRF